MFVQIKYMFIHHKKLNVQIVKLKTELTKRKNICQNKGKNR